MFRVADGQALGSVLEAALYCSKSLARIGLSLDGFLGPAVAAAVQALFRQQAAHAVAMFASATDAHKWVAMPVAQRPAQGGGEGDAPDLLAEAYSLMSHPPLAVLVNAVRRSSCSTCAAAAAVMSLVVQAWVCSHAGMHAAHQISIDSKAALTCRSWAR